MENIKIGCKGNAVIELQKLLGINADGDFGHKTEAAVIAFQKSKGLSADGIVGAKTWAALGVTNSDINIINKPLSVHLSSSKGRNIKYLVIHYTAGGSSKKGSALKCYDVWTNRQASCDFAVDDVDIVCFNNDIPNKYSWEVGDGKGKYGVTNINSIGIEICSNLKKGTSAAVPNHTGWYFTDAAINNAVKLSKYLMKKYNIPIDRVIRHYDASRKDCPGIVGWNTDIMYNEDGTRSNKKNNDSEWLKFKQKLK